MKSKKFAWGCVLWPVAALALVLYFTIYATEWAFGKGWEILHKYRYVINDSKFIEFLLRKYHEAGIKPDTTAEN